MDEKYQRQRREMEKYFTLKNLTKEKVLPSPFDGIEIKVGHYTTGEGTWNFTRAQVYKDEKLIADVKRNYSSFWLYWLLHSNGKRYLLCGEDYQGHTVIDLETGEMHVEVHTGHDKGIGFCWVEILSYDPDDNTLRVSGCYWGDVFEIVTYDFSDPFAIELPELAREDEPWEDDEEDD